MRLGSQPALSAYSTLKRIDVEGDPAVVTVTETGSTQDDLRALAADAADWPHLSGLRAVRQRAIRRLAEHGPAAVPPLAAELARAAVDASSQRVPRRETASAKASGDGAISSSQLRGASTPTPAYEITVCAWCSVVWSSAPVTRGRTPHDLDLKFRDMERRLLYRFPQVACI